MNIGWQYLLLFAVLASPFFFWLYEVYRKSFKEKDTYKDEFDRCQERADFWNLL